VLQFFFHDIARNAQTFTALLAYRNKLAEMLERFWLVTTHYLADRFITYGIT